MQRDLLAPLAIALLCVVAIAVASATLTDPVTTTGLDRDVGPPGDGNDDGAWDPLRLNLSDGSENESSGGSANIGPLCIPFLRTFAAKALAALLLVVFSYQLYRKIGSIGVAAGLAAVVPPGFILYAYLTVCRPPNMNDAAPFGFEQGNVTNNSSVGVGTGGGGGGAAVDPPIALLLLAGVLVVLLTAAFVRSTGDDADDKEPEPEPAPEEPDLAAVGSVAGEAADRIEGPADVENEVYRAWREMTGLLDVASPASSTPAEFEAAALDAGMSRSEVATLTDVFREVRYGGREPTPDREERAVEALRAIEDAHADDGGDAGSEEGST